MFIRLVWLIHLAASLPESLTPEVQALNKMKPGPGSNFLGLRFGHSVSNSFGRTLPKPKKAIVRIRHNLLSVNVGAKSEVTQVSEPLRFSQVQGLTPSSEHSISKAWWKENMCCHTAEKPIGNGTVLGCWRASPGTMAI
jgi:hypothetical protein